MLKNVKTQKLHLILNLLRTPMLYVKYDRSDGVLIG